VERVQSQSTPSTPNRAARRALAAKARSQKNSEREEHDDDAPARQPHLLQGLTKREREELLRELHSEHHPLQLIRKRELAELLTVDPWTIDNWRKKGRFPKPIVLSDQVLVWRLTDIDRWLQEKREANAPWSRRKAAANA
jgi:predicted DNA-binding transcriptional regulator AlpA